MSFAQTVVLAAFAGFTIYLGLPVGRLRNLRANAQAMLTAGAGGVILFLIVDVLSQALEPVTAALDDARAGASFGPVAADGLVLAGSVAVGLLSVTYVTSRLRARAAGPALPRQLAIGTAIGLGLHNFSEGLAIGASAASGETSLAVILVVGFALHNATEGFGIAAPLASGERPSWAFLAALGLIGGGPTFVGGVVGWALVSPLLSIAFLGLALGALVYVFNEMMAVVRRFSLPMAASTAILLGLMAGIGTDLILVFAGS
jgi:ZIP family zinc transporter